MAYYRGDYYRGVGKGDYYRGHGRGDPFWGALLKGIGTVAKGLLGIPSVPSMTTPPFALAPNMPAIGQGGTRDVTPAEREWARQTYGPRQLPPGAPPPMTMIPSHRVGAAMPGMRKRRHMNPGNVKALRRSIRRVCSFGNLVARTKHSLRKAANEVAPVHHTRKALPPARSR